MKIRELIKELDKLELEHGNINVHITDVITTEALAKKVTYIDGAVVISSVND